MKTCKCGYEGTDFSPKSNLCRTCVSKQNKLNPERNSLEYKTKIALNRVGFEVYGGVYGILEGSKLLYIGESDKTTFRCFEHLQGHKGRTKFVNFSKQRLNGLTAVLFWKGDNTLKRKIKEKELIGKLNPEFNDIYRTNR